MSSISQLYGYKKSLQMSYERYSLTSIRLLKLKVTRQITVNQTIKYFVHQYEIIVHMLRFSGMKTHIPAAIFIFCDLFCPLGKPADRAIYFTFRNFFFFLLWTKLPQYLLDRFSRSFHQIEGICVNFLDPVHFFWFLKGRYYGNQFSGKNGAKLPTPCTYRSVSPKQNGISRPQCPR